MPARNLYTDTYEYDEEDPEGYRSGRVVAGRGEDGNALAVKAFEIPPGQSLCPYHYEYEEEWLIVIEGEALLRTPAGEERLERGAIVPFPRGPGGAHKVSCAGTEPLHAVMFSSAREPSVAVYPDSDKLGVYLDNPDDEVLMYRRDGAIGYYDGEPTGQ